MLAVIFSIKLISRRLDVTQFAFLFQRPCSLSASDGVFMTAGAACMKCLTGLLRFFRFMLMAIMASFHLGISRLECMVACRAFSNTEPSMLLMGKCNYAKLGIKLDNSFIFRNFSNPRPLRRQKMKASL
jgi:hypothetical protein